MSLSFLGALLCSLFFMAACSEAAYKIFPKVDLPFACRAVLGFLPLFALESLVQLVFWNADLSSTQSCIKVFEVLRYALVLWGLGSFVKSSLKRSKALPRHLYLAALFTVLIFLPALIMWAGLHSSWDSDATLSWIPRAQVYSLRAFMHSSDELIQPTYVSLMPAFIGNSLPAFTPAWFFPHAFRIISLILTLDILFFLSRGLKQKWTQISIFALLLSGFPLKWINGYQDLWCAAFALISIYNFRRSKSALNYLLPLICLCAVKNEGLVFGVIMACTYAGFHLYAGTLKAEKEFLKKKDVVFLALFLFFALSWVLYSPLLKLKNEDLALVYPGFSVFISRWKTFGIKFIQGIQRKYQSYCLDGLIALMILAIKKKSLEKIDLLLVLQGLLCLIFPLVVIALTNHDFIWHMDTTFSRLSSTGLLLWVWAAIEVMDRSWSL